MDEPIKMIELYFNISMGGKLSSFRHDKFQEGTLCQPYIYGFDCAQVVLTKEW